MSGMDRMLLLALLVWLQTVATSAGLESLLARRVVALVGGLLVVALIWPDAPPSPGRAFPAAWLLVALAMARGSLDTPRVVQSLLHGLVALASVALLGRWLALLAAVGLPGWAAPLPWVIGVGLALVGWRLCRLVAGAARVWDYPVWCGGLGAMVLVEGGVIA